MNTASIDSPFLLSMESAVLATALSFAFGTALAYFATRLSRGRGALDAVLTLPLVLPPTVVGFFLLLVFGKRSPIGEFLLSVGHPLVFTFEAAVIAAFVVSMPLMYRTARGAFEQEDATYCAAARTLGIPEHTIFFRVLLPNAKSGLLAGLVLTFARALGEFGATILFAGNIPGETQTMSLAIYTAVQSGNDETALLWALALCLLSFIFLGALNLCLHAERRTA